MPATKGSPRARKGEKAPAIKIPTPILEQRITKGYNETSLENCRKCGWSIGATQGGYQGCSYYLITGQHRPHEETGGENCEVCEPRRKGRGVKAMAVKNRRKK